MRESAPTNGSGTRLQILTTEEASSMGLHDYDDDDETEMPVLLRFSLSYGMVHGPIVLGICIFGIAANLVNVLVLSRRKLRQCPTNFLLCGLSIAQLLLLVNFFCYSIYSTSLAPDRCDLEYKKFGWLLYLVFNVNLNVVLHSVALAHTTLLAVFRFLAVHFPNRFLSTLPRAKAAVYTTFTAGPILFLTFYVNTLIVPIPPKEITVCPGYNETEKYYFLTFRDGTLTNINFWVFAIGGKLFPCAALTILSALLIKDMKAAEARRRAMLGRSDAGAESQRMQTTIMLLLIVAMLVAVELPQGLLNILSGVLGPEFRQSFYSPLGDFFEMLTVFYSSVNFILYCAMSSQFRAAFEESLPNPVRGLLQRWCKRRHRHSPQKSGAPEGSSLNETAYLMINSQQQQHGPTPTVAL